MQWTDELSERSDIDNKYANNQRPGGFSPIPEEKFE